MMTNCILCPRQCHANRTSRQLGFCRASSDIEIALVTRHFGEEPCISGTQGSGTVFFSHCNLGCIFCQNHIVSHTGKGAKVNVARLSEIFIEQQSLGVHNINLVTPTHYAPQIVTALHAAKNMGLNVPIIYNTGSYELSSTIQSLDGYIDVYLPDLKFYDDKYSRTYAQAPDYFNKASQAVETMLQQVGSPCFDDNGLITRGVIIRHLALPGLVQDSKKILQFIHNTFGDSVYISLMNQYTPMPDCKKFPEINRPITAAEYDELVDYALSIGIENGFIQEGCTASTDYIPEFNLQGVEKKHNS